jgi:DNA-binding NtrC family response regulator
MQLKDLSIFLVDDDLFSLQLMEFAVRSKGMERVSSFTSGSECLNALTEEPDVIFLDHQMDHVIGTEVLKAIKRFNPDIYVVFVSGQQQVEIAVESLKYGAFDYIVKDEKLTERIDAVLEKIETVRQMLKRRSPSKLRRFFAAFSLA